MSRIFGAILLIVLSASLSFSGTASAKTKVVPPAKKTGKAAVKQPQTPDEFQTAAEIALDANYFDEAERITRDGLAKFPAAPGFHLLLGKVHAVKNHPEEAFYEFQWEMLRDGADRESGKKAADESRTIVQRAAAGSEVAKIVEAITKVEAAPAESADALSAIQKKRGSRFVLDLFLAEAKARAGDSRAAIAIYRSLLDRDENFVPAYIELAGQLQKSGKEDDAKKLLAQAKLIDADNWRWNPGAK